MGIEELAAIALQGGLVQQVLIVVAGALLVVAMALYVVLVVVRRDRA